jgi:hypothetical protein
MQYDLSKYESAFALFSDPNWKTTNRFPVLARQAMVFVALNFDYKDTDNRPAVDTLFGSESGMAFATDDVLKVLDKIKRLG